MNSRELACREFVELVTDYYEDALSPEDRACFEAHLEMCDGCKAYLEQMRMTVEAGGRLSLQEIPAGTMDELLKAFRDWRSTGKQA